VLARPAYGDRFCSSSLLLYKGLIHELGMQFVNGMFSTGYRATIGADFVSKTVPHPYKPDEEIALQIWVGIDI
jgi:hypothetical protein